MIYFFNRKKTVFIGIKKTCILFLFLSYKLSAQEKSFRLYVGRECGPENFIGCYTDGDTLTTNFLEENPCIALLCDGKNIWKKQGDMFLSSYEILVYSEGKLVGKPSMSWAGSKNKMIGLLPKMPEKIVVDKIKGSATVENKRVEIDVPPITLYRAGYSSKKCPTVTPAKTFPKEAFAPKIGEKAVLNNIFFATGKSELLPASYKELNTLADYLLKNENTIIQISGHTDNTGMEESNKILSQKRAKAVADYLISKKIEKERITSGGYGSSKPMVANDTEENKQQNRRVEFIINKK